MTARLPEKMDEDTGTKVQFIIPSPPVQDSKPSFGAIRSKHGHQTTSTPYVCAVQASGFRNMKRHCGSDPTLNCYTPISKAPHDIKYCGHQSFDTLSDAETHTDEPHTQLNLMSHFEGRAEEEFAPVRGVELGKSGIGRERYPAEKRRSLQMMDKSPSPYRNKRHSLDLSGDSGCFSTQTTRSDSHFSGEIPHPPFGSPVTEETFPGPVCLAGEQSARSLPLNSSGSFGEKCFASGPKSVFTNVDLSGQSSDSFHSNLTPSIGKKVSKLVLTFDSGYSVASMDTSGETTRNARSNATPSFGEKMLKFTKDRSCPAAEDFHFTPNLPLGDKFPVLPGGAGCSANLAKVSDKPSLMFRSESTLSFDDKVSKLRPSDSEHSVDITYLSGNIPSESPRPFDNVFDSQSTVTCESRCSVAIGSIRSDLPLAKVASHSQDYVTSVEKTSMKTMLESEVVCDVPQVMKRSRSQTFEERLAMRKIRIDQEIGLRIGKKYVDVVRELGRKMCTEALAKIFIYLSEEELCSLCLVSRQWKSAVELETNARLRRRKYIQENRRRIAETPQENRSKLLNPIRQQNFTNPNKPMSVIQTMEELPIARPAVPTLTKAEEFLQEARSLERTESLRKCPKCDSPARANEKDRCARCTKCRYEFCVSCRKLLHAGSDCVLHVRNPAPVKIGSKQSKQNLRRL